MSDKLMKRLRRLLLLLPAVSKAEQKGKGIPLARAVALTGARDEKELLGDIAAADGLWKDASAGDEIVNLYVEDGEVRVEYAHAFAAPPAFSLAEGGALLSALGPIEEGSGRALRTVAAKIRKAIPEALRAEAEALAHGLDLEPPPAGPWAGALREGIEKRLETRLEYKAVREDAVAARVVEPRLLFHRDGAWYLAAWSVEKGQEHLYRLDRIVTVEVGNRVFGEHKGPSTDRYKKHRLFFASGSEREVTVRFAPELAELVRSRWPNVISNGDGTVSVTFKTTPGNYLYGWILGHGGNARIEAPADIREQFLARVAELANSYSTAR
jgi:proteasome accessory factor C